MTREFEEKIEQLVRTKNLDREEIINTLKSVIIEAASSYYRTNVEIQLDNKWTVVVPKKVVKRVKEPSNEISIQDAKKYDSQAIEGAEVRVPISIEQLPRAVVYKIMNKFTQRLKDKERQIIVKEFSKKIGEIVRGEVQRIIKKENSVILAIERVDAEGKLPFSELLPGEFEKIKQGEKKLAVITGIDDKENYILLSRTHPDFLKKLLEREIPEIMDGTVEIKQVARIPGKRSKVAVFSRELKLDPIGTVIGSKGTRLNPIQKELGGEKVDIVKWDNDLIKFAVNAIQSPYVLTAYRIEDKIYIVVEDEHVGETKGVEGYNVILASKLIGKDIVILAYSEYIKPKGIVTLLEIQKSFPPTVLEILRKHGFYSFNEEPTLASLYNIGLDEKTSLKLIEFIEEKLNE
ncbi:MAG: transcription termination factor NusA [candidate division WOR-3 bacterium]|nr:transcription termination factor NusA [candidate division WOR-3 bacterium]MCX7947023.1 transcription termination factor NusA [candidate division WOR-3 bacterium]MDW8149936.1 transcription termination factor NusA [candidate division WOR-3 bacterium]